MGTVKTFTVKPLGVEIAVLGPKSAERFSSRGWSLQQLQTPEDATNNLCKGLYRVLREMNVEYAYAPHVVAASAAVANPAELNVLIELGDGVVLRRNASLPADGVFLGSGKAFVMSSVGCPVIVAKYEQQRIVAHAGRDSLIDRGAVMGNPTRRHMSIVDAIIAAFEERGAHRKEIDMCMLLALPSHTFEHPFGHPKYGEFNKKLFSYIRERWPKGVRERWGAAYVDLEFLFLEQAFQAGIRNKWTEHPLSEHLGLAHTRDGHPDASKRRNLVVVKRLNS